MIHGSTWKTTSWTILPLRPGKNSSSDPAAGGESARPVVPVVPDLTTLYGKAVTVLYMKGTILIGGIPFNDTTDAWNYMLGIPDEKLSLEPTVGLTDW